MFFELPLFWFFAYFMFVLFLFFGLGSLVAKHRKATNSSPEEYSFFIEGTLLSLLLGFTFAQAAGKFEKRKESFKNEVNSISTAMMRIQLYPDSLSKILKDDFKAYIQTREDYYNALSDEAKAEASLNKSAVIGKQLFLRVAEFAKDPSNQSYTLQMVPALNNMFDVSTEIEMYRKSFIPVAILRLLFLVCVILSFIYGFNQSNNSSKWIKCLGFSLLVSMTFVLILDLQDYRRGNISHEHNVQYITKLKNLLN